MSTIHVEREALWHYLCSLRNIGLMTVEKILAMAGDVEGIIEITPDQLAATGLLDKSMLREWDQTTPLRKNPMQAYEAMQKKPYRFISAEHPEYPKRLLSYEGMPYGLWVRGQLPADDHRSVAIIGSRVCTEYGRQMAERIGRQMGEWGIGVISGMATGVDTAGHRGALQSGGYTLGVLGCGIDICYPAHNIELYQRLATQGGLISEFAPGMPGFPNNFRQRNRLISGLADCVIVTEAREKSGTQVTVSWALDQGKDIFAVPGRMTDAYSRGCNRMIDQGAGILYDLEVLKEYFAIGTEAASVEKPAVTLTAEETMVLEKIGTDMKHFESLLMKTNLPTGQLWSVLFSLEAKEVIVQPVKNYYRLR